MALSPLDLWHLESAPERMPDPALDRAIARARRLLAPAPITLRDVAEMLAHEGEMITAVKIERA